MSHKAALLFLISSLAAGGVAHADGGVDVTPFGPGGIQWTVTTPAFETPFNYGQRLADGYQVPVAGSFRAACFVLSPWLPVGHGDGTGQFIPDFFATWQGILFPRTGQNAPVFNIRYEVQDLDGSVVTATKTVTSALFRLTPIFFPTPDSVLYRGDLSSSATSTEVLQNLDVNEDDLVRVSICDLAPNASLKVRGLVLRTLPFDN
ncbi:MAG: hypothetical protein H7138_16895 [Myxococcales bacterium]|nr:hypothetical protein [Myxococcales bacterium]